MTHDQAAAVMNALVGLDPCIGAIDMALEKLDDGDENVALRRALGNLIGQAYETLFFPIERLYPDLIPDRHP